MFQGLIKIWVIFFDYWTEKCSWFPFQKSGHLSWQRMQSLLALRDKPQEPCFWKTLMNVGRCKDDWPCCHCTMFCSSAGEWISSVHISLKYVNDFYDCSGKWEQRVCRDLGGSACRHVLQTELLNCGLEQLSGMPWPREKGSAEGRGNQLCSDGFGTYVGRVWALEELMKAMHHFDSMI